VVAEDSSIAEVDSLQDPGDEVLRYPHSLAIVLLDADHDRLELWCPDVCFCCHLREAERPAVERLEVYRIYVHLVILSVDVRCADDVNYP